jgi:hypothetical protein
MRPEDYVPGLAELYIDDPNAKRLLNALASRDDLDRYFTTVETVEEILYCSRQEAIQTSKALANRTFVAYFVVGRKGHKTRLQWRERPQKVAKEVIEEVIKNLHSLAEKADSGDKEAQTNLAEKAIVAGLSEKDFLGVDNWAARAEMIAPANRGAQVAQGEEKARGGGETPSDTPTKLGSVENVTVGTSQNPVEPRFVDTKILLRPDLWVILSLPKDLTESEAKRLAGVVRNLWLVPSKENEFGTPTSGNGDAVR